MTETAAAPRIAVPPPNGSGAVRAPEPHRLVRRRLRERLADLSPRQVALLCVLAYVVLAVLAYLPVSPLDARQLPVASSHNPAGSDPFQMTWFLSWVPFALTHGQSLFHTNYIDYPSGVNLADNTTVPLLGILGWPITATLGPVAAFNFLVRLSFAASATSMFFVMKRWCRSWQGPFLAGLLYAFGPYTAAQELHLDLIFIPLPPLLVLLADELVRCQRMRPWLLGALIGLVAALQYLVSPDVLSGCCAIMILAGIGLGLRFRHELSARLGYMLRALPFGVLGFGVLAGYPILEMLVGPGHLHGPVISINALQRTRADLLGPAMPTSNQLLVPGVVSHLGDYFVDGNLSENGSYLGIPLLVLLAVIVRRFRRDATVMTFLWLGVSAFVLSLGSYLVIGTWRSPLPLPEYVYAHLPLLENTIPARYALYVLLFVCLILGIGLDRAITQAKSGSGQPEVTTTAGEGLGARLLARWNRLGTPRARGAVVAGLVVLSLIPAVPFKSRGLLWSASLPTAIEKAVKPGSVVLTYPFTTPASTQPMAWQATDHMWFRLMGGYANIAVPGERVGQRWPPLLRPRSVQELLGYTSIGDRFPQPPVPGPALEAQLPQYLKRYGIGAVVAWTGGSGLGTNYVEPTVAYWYLRHALGTPQVTGRSFAIWLPVHGGWGHQGA